MGNLSDLVGCGVAIPSQYYDLIHYGGITPEELRAFNVARKQRRQELSDFMDRNFADIGMRLEDGHIDNGLRGRLSYVVEARFNGHNGELPDLGIATNALVGSTIVTKESFEAEIDGEKVKIIFNYADKIAIEKPFRRNGILRIMIVVANEVSSGEGYLPLYARTTIEANSRKYKEYASKSGKFGEYYIHLFLRDNLSQSEYHQALRNFPIIAEYVSKIPKTAKPLNENPRQ